MEKKFIAFNHIAPYFLLGAPGPEIKHIWFVCHGYGQLAKYFIKKFDVLNDGSHLIVAPEGLSRFYLEGFSGKVGATWMTREERETDIQNYLTYLETLAISVVNQTAAANLSITLLGFSQGAATASRWMTETSLTISRFILWGGIFPPDLNQEKAREKLLTSKNYLVVGNKDPFFRASRIEEYQTICAELGIYPEKKVFEGGHDIIPGMLKEFL